MEDRIKNIMGTVFNIPVDEINNESSPDTIESWDSLKHISLVVALEDEFRVEFSTDEIAEMLNFKLIIQIMTDTLNKRN